MLVTALEAIPEIPNMETITEKIIHEERKIKEKERTKKDEQAFASERYKPQGRQCFYCGQSGHIKRFCRKYLKEQEDRKKEEKANVVELGPRKTSKSKQVTKQNEDSSSESDSCGFIAANHAMSAEVKGKNKEWILDSGATSPMCNDKKKFKGKLKKLKNSERIKVGDGAFVEAHYEGTVELEVRISDNNTVKYTMENVLYAPDLAYNLLSV